MSAAPDARREPQPEAREGERPLLPIHVVIKGETRRLLSDSRIAPDPDRLAQGWERRFIADEARAAEMMELYRALGYEVVADALRSEHGSKDCDDCRLLAERHLRTIYTRPGPASRDGREAGGFPMFNPIDHLLEEHRTIMAEIGPLRAVVEDLRRRGDAALPAALPTLRSVGQMMATRLLRHARKEDEALFPALEAVFGTEGTPTAVMREEHREIHERARLFRETLRELNEVEHPAIVAGGEALRELAQLGESASALRETGEDIVRRLDLHFAKEEDILFPMAREILSRDALADVAHRMALIDAAAVP